MLRFLPLVVGLSPGYEAMQAYTQATAVSEAASQICTKAIAIVASAEGAQSLFGKKASALSGLYKQAEEFSAAEESEVIRGQLQLALAKSRSFIRALPDDVPLPEFAFDPDGAVSMDWIASRFRIFSVSVGNTNRLAFAWIDGADRGHGVAHFNGLVVPRRILEGIKSTTSLRDAPIWAA